MRCMKVPFLYYHLCSDQIRTIGIIKFSKLHSVIGDKEICTLRLVTQSPDLTTLIGDCPIPFSDSVSGSG